VINYTKAVDDGTLVHMDGDGVVHKVVKARRCVINQSTKPYRGRTLPDYREGWIFTLQSGLRVTVDLEGTPVESVCCD
jgi:hypothetical protein